MSEPKLIAVGSAMREFALLVSPEGTQREREDRVTLLGATFPPLA